VQAGRIRRDPRAGRSPLRAGPDTASSSAKKAGVAAPTVVCVDQPAYYVLAIPDLEGGRLSQSDRDLVAAARTLADQGGGAVIALALEPCKEDFGALGADRVQPLIDPGPDLSLSRTRSVLSTITALSPRQVLLPEFPAHGGDLGRRIAAALGERPAARVIRISGEELICRADGGRSEWTQPLRRVVLCEPGIATLPNGRRWEGRLLPLLEPTVLRMPEQLEDGGLISAHPAEVPLHEAEFIVAAGNGVQDWAAFHRLSAALGASEGGSRVVCDAGHLPRSRQIGASGTTVCARCYISFGLSGAVQHLQGITQCEHVIAINTDAQAEILKRATLGIVGDAQEIMRALESVARRRTAKS
jgi:electron transfer flavoprotein alpha subunit